MICSWDLDPILTLSNEYLSFYHSSIATTILHLSGIQSNPGELVPKETFTHSQLSWSSIVRYLLPPSFMIYGFLFVQFTCLTVFSTISLQVFLVYLLAWHPPLHTPYISSPNHCHLFTARAHIIATCFAVVVFCCYNVKYSDFCSSVSDSIDKLVNDRLTQHSSVSFCHLFFSDLLVLVKQFGESCF